MLLSTSKAVITIINRFDYAESLDFYHQLEVFNQRL